MPVPRPAHAAPRAGHDFSRVPARSVASGAGRGLTITPATDASEHEAERIGREVMAGAGPAADPLHPTGAGEVRVQPKRIPTAGAEQGRVPPRVHDVLRAPGNPLDAASRAFFEPRFGRDFSQVRVHADGRSADAAASVRARAFTVGRDIVFGAGEYAPGTDAGRRLLSHELVHTVQQQGGGGPALQRTPCIDERGSGPFRVSVIGAPGPGEISANHPYQFMNAALYQGVDRNTVWIVERTGYEAGGVNTATIESSAAPGCLVWLTPQTPVPQLISSEFPNGSISSATVYSHGLPGMVTLRYGWESRGLSNYGLTLSEVRTLSGTKFTPDATIDFDSCNTGTAVDEGNLAQETALHTGRTVRAWTGRTSYAEVNDGPADGDVAVQESQIYRNSMDWTELGSRIRGRTPVRTTFSPPGARVGGFASSFQIITRLPSTRQFTVPAGGTVVVRLSNGAYVRPDRAPTSTDRAGIYLISSGTVYDSREKYESLRVDHPDTAVFTGLEGGEYYLEITAESAPGNPYETLESDIAVDVHER